MRAFGIRVAGMAAFVAVQCMLAAVCPAGANAVTVHVQSDHLDIWEKKQEALFTGNVHLVREDFELYCDSLRVFYLTSDQGGGIDHALAIGNVRMIQGDKHGSSDSAVIDNRRQIVTLTGHAVMEQEGGRVEGETIVHDMDGKTTEVRQGNGGRVSLRIDDKSMDATGKPEVNGQDEGRAAPDGDAPAAATADNAERTP